MGPQLPAGQRTASTLQDDRKTSSASRDAAAGVSVQAGACALSFDGEEYFQVWSLAERAPRREWAHWPSRVEASTESLLEILAEHSVTATFFTLGCVAERHPQLVRRIVACGHELASHGYSHELAYLQTRPEFLSDITRSKLILEEKGGCRVTGYRAPSFSLGSSTPWAHAALAEAGYLYSSSSHPVKNDHYGDLSTPEMTCRDGVLEVPIAVARVLGRNLPCGGGGYFRLLPKL